MTDRQRGPMKTLTIILTLFSSIAAAQDLARDVQPSVFISQLENPWLTHSERFNEGKGEHDPGAEHLEMGVQLEHALAVARDELRKVNQFPGNPQFQPTITILIYRQDGHTAVVAGDRTGITSQLLEGPVACGLAQKELQDRR